jgi:hypothetical protein
MSQRENYEIRRDRLKRQAVWVVYTALFVTLLGSVLFAGVVVDDERDDNPYPEWEPSIEPVVPDTTYNTSPSATDDDVAGDVVEEPEPVADNETNESRSGGSDVVVGPDVETGGEANASATEQQRS